METDLSHSHSHGNIRRDPLKEIPAKTFLPLLNAFTVNEERFPEIVRAIHAAVAEIEAMFSRPQVQA